MVYSDYAIKDAMRDNRIVIDPFCEKQLGTNSYDVRLGNWYYIPNEEMQIYSPYFKEHVDAYWLGPYNAYDMKKINPMLEGMICIPGHTTILAHTLEIIGAHAGITTKMHARSSVARVGLSVCKCAGAGDVGYISRWTMEISNHNKADVLLPVGMRIAQIMFDYVGDTEKEYKGKYGSRYEWTPEDMLPKLYNDWDVIPNVIRSAYTAVPYIDICNKDGV